MNPSTQPTPRLAAASAVPQPAVAWTRAVAVGSVLGLIALGLAWELFLAPTGNRTLALKVLPLTFPLAGLLKNRMYTYRWVSLFVWLYFIEGVVRAAGDQGIGAWLAGVEILLCVALFAACAAHVRWRLKPVRLDGHAAPRPVPSPQSPPSPET